MIVMGGDKNHTCANNTMEDCTCNYFSLRYTGLKFGHLLYARRNIDALHIKTASAKNAQIWVFLLLLLSSCSQGNVSRCVKAFPFRFTQVLFVPNWHVPMSWQAERFQILSGLLFHRLLYSQKSGITKRNGNVSYTAFINYT